MSAERQPPHPALEGRLDAVFERDNPPNEAFLAIAERAYAYTVALKGGLVASGLENIPEVGPVIIASSHTHYSDITNLGTVLRRTMDINPYYLAKSELWDGSYGAFVGRVMEWGGSRPVRKGTALHVQPELCDMLEKSLVQEKAHVVIFGEETRVKPTDPVENKTGIARIAMAHGASILPAAVADGRNGLAVVTFGKLRKVEKNANVDLSVRNLPGDGTKEAVRELTSELNVSVQACRDAAQDIRRRLTINDPSLALDGIQRVSRQSRRHRRQHGRVVPKTGVVS